MSFEICEDGRLGREYRISFPISLRVRPVWVPNLDDLATRRRRMIVAFGQIKFLRFGFHLRVGVQ